MPSISGSSNRQFAPRGPHTRRRKGRAIRSVPPCADDRSHAEHLPEASRPYPACDSHPPRIDDSRRCDDCRCYHHRTVTATPVASSCRQTILGLGSMPAGTACPTRNIRCNRYLVCFPESRNKLPLGRRPGHDDPSAQEAAVSDQAARTLRDASCWLSRRFCIPLRQARHATIARRRPDCRERRPGHC